MKQTVEISPEQKKIITDLLEKFLPDCEVWVYGSRTKSTSNPKSDLDMVVFADKEQRLQVADIKEAFEESNLPFCVDLFAWHEIPEQFKKNIITQHILFRENKTEQVTDQVKRGQK
jgi:predicted nucleotidyltransferase